MWTESGGIGGLPIFFVSLGTTTRLQLLRNIHIRTDRISFTFVLSLGNTLLHF
jgi:hypothetical protein